MSPGTYLGVMSSTVVPLSGYGFQAGLVSHAVQDTVLEMMEGWGDGRDGPEWPDGIDGIDTR